MYHDSFMSVPAVAEERRMGIEVTAVFKGKKEEAWRWLTRGQLPSYLVKKSVSVLELN